MNLLVVCLGNICRSPMAEGILRKKITDNGGNDYLKSIYGVGYKFVAE